MKYFSNEKMHVFFFVILILSLNSVRSEIENFEENIKKILNYFKDIEIKNGNFLVANKRENSQIKTEEEMSFNRKFCKINKRLCYFYGK